MTHSTRPRSWLVACSLAAALSAGTQAASALQNGLARTPPMGWNSYNKFGGDVTEAQVKAIADAFVADGLLAAGYQYIVVDYCWMQSRDGAGKMIPSAKKFPAGMKSLSDYVHSKGLKFGMYQSPTKVTCCGESGSFGHEKNDAQQFADWGVDYVKYDWCGVQSGENGKVTKEDVMSRYSAMSEAITATGRPMVYAMCEKGQGAKGVLPSTWSEPMGHMWRTGNDIAATWARVLTAFDLVRDLAKYAKPGGWNDPDMLEVGNGSLTEAENRSHMSLWAIVAAPLMMGNDPSKMTAAVKAILTNAEVIAVDQDPAGKQGTRVANSGQTEVWAKPMMDGSVSVLLFNRGGSAASVTAQWSAIGVSGNSKVRNLWKHADEAPSDSGFTAMVPSHDVVMIRVYPPGVTPGTPGAGGMGGAGGSASAGGTGSGGMGGAGGTGTAGMSMGGMSAGGMSAGGIGAAGDAPMSGGGLIENGGASSAGGSSGAAPSGANGGAGQPPSGSGATSATPSSGGASSGGSAPTSTPAEEDDSGCSYGASGTGRASSGLLLGALALVGLGAFRKRRSARR